MFSFFTIASIVSNLSAQNYLITFAGIGESITVDSVKVENLNTGNSLNLSRNDVLHLAGPVAVSQLEDKNPAAMRIYPNPMLENATIGITPPVEGEAVISIFELTGKTLVQIHSFLENTSQEFSISGIKNGLYLINITGNSYQFSSKLQCDGIGNGNIKIEKISRNQPLTWEKSSKKEYNKTSTNVDMPYSVGDRLKFTGISGKFSTIITDVPLQDKTITFNFISCVDGDNNNYPIVEIGNQVWMAENLKTTKLIDGTDIPLISEEVEWSSLSTPGYCWFNKDEVSNKSIYGALYNWYAINTDKVCPAGWLIPGYTEWSSLTDYLGGESISGAKLKETGTTHWLSPNKDATNETGFTGLPAGPRFESGSFAYAGYNSIWWSSTATSNYFAMSYMLGYENSEILRIDQDKRCGFSARCIKKDGKPSVITSIATSISSSSAICGGNVTDEGESTVTARGVCWSKYKNPTIIDSITNDGEGSGSFTSQITGLTEGTLYYVRAYAINNTGISYGNEISFATKVKITVTDLDGNVYNTVIIGNQLWMVENLKTTKFNDGTAIPLVSDSAKWDNMHSPAFCWYNNEASFKSPYGGLYNWYSVATGNICPTGWHIPNDSDWSIITSYLGGVDAAGGKLKETGTNHWITPNTAATNESGFTGLPGGIRSSSGFFNIGKYGFWWSSTEDETHLAWYQFLYSNSSKLGINSASAKAGLSVRCIKDFNVIFLLPTISTTNPYLKTQTSAFSGGNITSEGTTAVTARGVCWNTSANPTITDNKTNDGEGGGNYTSSITGLTANTTYYVRAYATNSAGTTYGKEFIFKTYSGTVSDVEGNIYNTVTIGNKTWLAENLKTTKYDNGDLIGTTSPATLDITDETAPKYQWAYNGDESLVATYGRLYTWYAVSDLRNVCPTNWHVSSDQEWTILTDFLGGVGAADVKLKESGYAPWYNQSATNESGFSALPGGDRSSWGIFSGQEQAGCWWGTPTEEHPYDVWGWRIGMDYGQVYRINLGHPDGVSVRCVKDSEEIIVLPKLTTAAVSFKTQTSAICGGNVISIGGANVTSRGVCWSKSVNPTIANSKTTDGTGVGNFTSSITDLEAGSVYYVRAYATNSFGTNYGKEYIFNTNSILRVSDIEGNVYNTTTIGTQIWMAENLKTTKYNNGDLIGTTSPVSLDISSETEPKYQWSYDGDESLVATYGRLYTWYAVNDIRNLCPSGWHVPSNDDWTVLTDYLGGKSLAGGKLKETGFAHWFYPNEGATNETGFTALPGGFRYYQGNFNSLEVNGIYWSSTEDGNSAWHRRIYFEFGGVSSSVYEKAIGYSVRCIKD